MTTCNYISFALPLNWSRIYDLHTKFSFPNHQYRQGSNSHLGIFQVLVDSFDYFHFFFFCQEKTKLLFCCHSSYHSYQRNKVWSIHPYRWQAARNTLLINLLLLYDISLRMLSTASIASGKCDFSSNLVDISFHYSGNCALLYGSLKESYITWPVSDDVKLEFLKKNKITIADFI